MPAISFTKAQQQAISAPHGNLLVSAAAGSGKTAVLTERVIRLLTGDHPVPADRMVIVTFTVMAAIEMRQRIEAKLAALLEQDPDSTLLQSQQMMLSNAKISTIHALCSELVKDNFQSLGLPPNYRVADESELGNLQKDVLEQVLEESYTEGDNAFLALAGVLSAQDDSRLERMADGIYQFVRAYPFPMRYLDEFASLYDNPSRFWESEWGESVKKQAEQVLQKVSRMLRWAEQQAASDEKLGKQYGGAIESDLSTVEVMLCAAAEGDWQRVCSAVHSYKKQPLGVVRGHPDPAWKDRVKDTRNAAADLLLDLRARFLPPSPEALEEDYGYLSAHSRALFGVVRRYDAALQEAKREAALIDFGDLEHFTLQLLVEEQDGCYRKTDLARSLSGQYDEIMIDECQDINTIQNLIFWALSRGAEYIGRETDELLLASENLFLVGDVKQSIYRFRNAMPSLFTRRKNLFPLYDETAGEGAAGKILLQDNFRSRRTVTDSINRIFSRVMSEEVGEIAYGESEALIASAKYGDLPHCETELHFVNTDMEEPDGEQVRDKKLMEADYIARLIQQMVDTGYQVEENGTARRCTYRDFCVLLRAKKGKTERFLQSFVQYGIPCYANQSNGYFDSPEVAVILSLMRVLDNPLLDLDLLAVLLSQMFSFTPDEAAAIRLKNRKAPLYSALVQAAEDGDAKCRLFLDTLSFLREQAVFLPVSRLIQTIYDQTGFLFVVQSMVSGEQKQANLRLLLSYAESYESTGCRGLDGFLRYVDRAMERGDSFSCANTVSESMNVVRIMTIHASKGLEFPICIVADMAKQFNEMDTRKGYCVHARYGFGMKIRRPETLQEYTTPSYEVIRLKMEREMRSEEMRIFYVALTRAREKLIMVGSGKDIRKSVQGTLDSLDFDGGVSPFGLMQMRSYLKWVVSALADEPDFRLAAGGSCDEVQAGPVRCVFADAPAAADSTESELEFTAQPAPDLVERLRRQTGFVYPYEAATRLPAKVTVTQIAKSKQQETGQHIEPMALHADNMPDGAARGTILHAFMQYADFGAAKADLDAEILRLTGEGFLTGEQAGYLNKQKIRAFLQSQLLKRMLAAVQVYREYQFIYQIDSSELPQQEDSVIHGEKILMQGIADAVIEEEDGLVIVDYKTDYLEDDAVFAARYYDQLRIYKEALEEYFGMPVKECLIYSLHLERPVRVL